MSKVFKPGPEYPPARAIQIGETTVDFPACWKFANIKMPLSGPTPEGGKKNK